MTIPVPDRPSGVLRGNPAAEVSIDVFLDIQCPHSKRAWPTLMQVMDQYQDQVSLRTHLITLSDHRQAWDVSLGIFAYADGDAEKFYQFTTYLYEHQSRFSNAEFRMKTHQDLQQLIVDLADQHGGVDKQALLKRINDHDIYIMGRTPIRYAATKSVWATPTFFVNNGVNVPVNHASDLNEWAKMLEPMFK